MVVELTCCESHRICLIGTRFVGGDGRQMEELLSFGYSLFRWLPRLEVDISVIIEASIEPVCTQT